MSNFFA
jgi:glucose-6-phosphate isomerase